MTVKLKEIIAFEGLLRVGDSGLRIGGSGEAAEIGGTDNPIIRHPITKRPYVPGSSVKGKVRSLLELKHSPETQDKGLPCSCGSCEVCLLFGCHNSRNTQSPTRLIFRDCQPTDGTIDKWQDAGVDSDIKTEVIIDRKKGLAYGRIGPRTAERIPAGSEFHFSFSMRVFENDDKKKLLGFLAEGFELLEKDYLGGYGSRGYGKVEFVASDGTPMSEHLRQAAEK